MNKNKIVIVVLLIWCIGATFYALKPCSGSHAAGPVSAKEARDNYMEALERASQEKPTGREYRAKPIM